MEVSCILNTGFGIQRGKCTQCEPSVYQHPISIFKYNDVRGLEDKCLNYYSVNKVELSVTGPSYVLFACYFGTVSPAFTCNLKYISLISYFIILI